MGEEEKDLIRHFDSIRYFGILAFRQSVDVVVAENDMGERRHAAYAGSHVTYPVAVYVEPFDSRQLREGFRYGRKPAEHRN